MSTSAPHVDLQQLRHQAKDLCRAVRTGTAADVLERIRRYHPRLADATPQQVEAELTLQEAQHVIAREQGYDSWPKLVVAVGAGEGSVDGQPFTKDELRGLETVHESFAALLQVRLRAHGSRGVEVRLQHTDQVTFARYQASRPPGWSYSYLATPFTGAAIFDMPSATARILDAEVSAFLEEVVDGTLELHTMEGGPQPRFAEGTHKRFAGPVFEDIEAAWGPAMTVEMHEIEFEPDPERTRRQVAGPDEMVAYVQLEANDGVAMRLCYPHRFLGPALAELEQIGVHRASE